MDDDDRVLNALGRSFRLSLPNVHTASDPEEALNVVRTLHPSLTVIDLRLGETSGIDLVRDVKREAPDSIVALISGYLSIDITVEAVRAGADIVLAKPVTAKDIVRRAQGEVVDDEWTTPTLAEAEDAHIDRVLADCGGNVSEAARRLGVYRSSLQRKLRKRDPRS